MFEKLIFNILALALFTIIFLKLIKKNDTSYIYILTLQFVGIAINFIELFFSVELNAFFKVLIYVFSVIIPLIILWVEIFKKIDFPEMFNTGIAKFFKKIGNIEKAKQKTSAFLNKNPNSYIAHKLMAELYEEQKNYDAAISEYMRVTDLKSNDFDSTYKLCNVLNKNKQNNDAINLLQEILKHKPEEEKVANLLGEIYFEEEMYKEAISVYMVSLKYHPESYELYYNLGMAHTMVNDFQRAKEFYEKAAEINSLLYNAKLNLGQIALLYGDLEEAEKYFTESSKQKDLESGSYYYLAQVALLKGDIDKAINYMNVAVELEPKIYKQIQKDPLFAIIRNKINIPNEKYTQNKSTLSKKEKNVNKHLTKTCILVKNLNKQNIITHKKVKQNENQKIERQKE